MMKKCSVALAALAALASGSAFAQQAGDWVIGAGWMNFSPQDSSKPLTVTAPVASVVPGSGASVSNADTLGLTANYFFDSHWAVEGVVGVPPSFKLNGTGTLASAGQLGKAKQWSPSVLVKYYFLDGNAPIRPYVGLGGTYVWYSDVTLTSGLQGAVAQLTHTPLGATNTTAKLDSSFAPVFNVGAAWQFSQHWGLALSVSYIPLKTTAKLTTVAINGLPVMQSQAALKLDPIVTFLHLTYKF